MSAAQSGQPNEWARFLTRANQLVRQPGLVTDHVDELDERSPLRVATELEARIPAATLVVIPGVGHISNAEAPEAFNACVREFLRSLDP